jgi:preprotein translocase subunit SecF
MYIIQHKNIFLGLTGVLALLAFFAIGVFGLKPGIEFTGGTSIGITVENDTSTRQDIEGVLGVGLEQTSFSIQELGESGYTIKSAFLEESTRALVVDSLQELEGVNVSQLSSVGPTIGSELRQKSMIAVAIVVVLIVLFVAFAFRHVSKPVSPWLFGATTIAALIFDVLIAVGAFAVWGVLFGAEVDSLFIIALLTVLGYSVNDTIIVFDRIREKLADAIGKKHKKDTFEETVGKSINETLTRSINTSLTTSLALLTLYILGGEPTRIFALTLLAGVLSGTYSSIFFASPLLVLFSKMGAKKKK